MIKKSNEVVNDPFFQILSDEIFSSEIVIQQALSDDWLKPVSNQEEIYIQAAVSKRQAEFRAGRHTAKRALEQLGFAPFPIDMSADRAPIWPTGVVGSISHSDELCVAAVARQAKIKALGLDVEPHRALEPELLPYICTKNEILALQKTANMGLFAKYIFSIKESFYKAYYPVVNHYLDFLQAEFSWSEVQAMVVCGKVVHWYDFSLDKLINVDPIIPNFNASWRKVISKLAIVRGHILSITFLLG